MHKYLDRERHNLLAQIITGYAEAFLWTNVDIDGPDYNRETGDGPTYYDHGADLDDVSDEVLARWTLDIISVVDAHPIALRMYLDRAVEDATTSPAHAAQQFGFDLLLTRDGHGAGFWDRGLGELGDYLTEVAQSLGEDDAAYMVGDVLCESTRAIVNY